MPITPVQGDITEQLLLASCYRESLRVGGELGARTLAFRAEQGGR